MGGGAYLEPTQHVGESSAAPPIELLGRDARILTEARVESMPWWGLDQHRSSHLDARIQLGLIVSEHHGNRAAGLREEPLEVQVRRPGLQELPHGIQHAIKRLVHPASSHTALGGSRSVQALRAARHQEGLGTTGRALRAAKHQEGRGEVASAARGRTPGGDAMGRKWGQS